MGSSLRCNMFLYFFLDTNATQEQLATLLKLTERYCVVYQTINRGTAIETSIQTIV